MAEEADKARAEIHGQLFHQQVEIERLEGEVARLLQSNQDLLTDNQELRRQLDFARKAGFENIQAIQGELARKINHSENTDKQLAYLQEQFVSYRDEKNKAEHALRVELEKATSLLKSERENHLRDKEMVRLTLETDCLSLKSSFEVRIELLCQEKLQLQQAIELLKDQVQRVEDDCRLLEFKAKNDPEKAKLID